MFLQNLGSMGNSIENLFTAYTILVPNNPLNQNTIANDNIIQ